MDIPTNQKPTTQWCSLSVINKAKHTSSLKVHHFCGGVYFLPFIIMLPSASTKCFRSSRTSGLHFCTFTLQLEWLHFYSAPWRRANNFVVHRRYIYVCVFVQTKESCNFYFYGLTSLQKHLGSYCGLSWLTQQLKSLAIQQTRSVTLARTSTYFRHTRLWLCWASTNKTAMYSRHQFVISHLLQQWANWCIFWMCPRILQMGHNLSRCLTPSVKVKRQGMIHKISKMLACIYWLAK